MPSIDELRRKPASRPERSYQLCTDGTIPVEIANLVEQDQLLAQAEPSGPARLADGMSPEREELRGKIAAARDRMDEASGVLTLRASMTNGEWVTFTDANPARAKGEPGHDRDSVYAGTRVNLDAVIANLSTFAVAWDGEPIQPADLPYIIEAAAVGDLRAMAAEVVSMYEVGLDFRSLRAALSGALQKSHADGSPSALASAIADSKGGSPDALSTPSTETATVSD